MGTCQSNSAVLSVGNSIADNSTYFTSNINDLGCEPTIVIGKDVRNFPDLNTSRNFTDGTNTYVISTDPDPSDLTQFKTDVKKYITSAIFDIQNTTKFDKFLDNIPFNTVGTSPADFANELNAVIDRHLDFDVVKATMNLSAGVLYINGKIPASLIVYSKSFGNISGHTLISAAYSEMILNVISQDSKMAVMVEYIREQMNAGFRIDRSVMFGALIIIVATIMIASILVNHVQDSKSTMIHATKLGYRHV